MQHRRPNKPAPAEPSRLKRYALHVAHNRRSATLAVAVGVTILTGLTAAITPFVAEATRHPVELPTANATNSTTAEPAAATPTIDSSENTATYVAETAQPLPSNADKWQELPIKSGDTITSLLAPYVASRAELHALVNTNRESKRLARLRAGDTINIQTDADNRLLSLRYSYDDANALHIDRIADGFAARNETLPLERRTENTSGVIETSLFASAQAAGLSDATILELAQLFGWDIDFALDLRQGDRYSVVYEQSYHNEHPVGQPHIVAAEFVNDGKTYRALYYRDKSGHSDYYSPDGKLMRKAFFRTPVDFSRISSKFSVARKHPILNRIRAHRGVDYAAPAGTPVKATADGAIASIGELGGFGKTIVLKHGAHYTTLYAHLSRYARGIRAGGKIKQGDVIGYVGQSGLATGPHLHYEFRVDGVHRNPLAVKVAVNDTVPNSEKANFISSTRGLTAQLDIASSRSVALNNVEANSTAAR